MSTNEPRFIVQLFAEIASLNRQDVIEKIKKLGINQQKKGADLYWLHESVCRSNADMLCDLITNADDDTLMSALNGNDDSLLPSDLVDNARNVAIELEKSRRAASGIWNDIESATRT